MKQGPQRPNKTNQDLINERVRFPEVLLIGANGEQFGKMSSKAAYDVAVQADLDLVCVAPNANPPVCKIMNYGKYRFEQKKKAKENKKKQHTIEIKEIQLTPQIGQHDIDTKARAARRFLEEGNKVKVGVRYRGRQLSHVEVGEEVMNKFIQTLEDVAVIEKAPFMEGKWLNAILAAKRKCPRKTGKRWISGLHRNRSSIRISNCWKRISGIGWRAVTKYSFSGRKNPSWNGSGPSSCRTASRCPNSFRAGTSTTDSSTRRSGSAATATMKSSTVSTAYGSAGAWKRPSS